MIMLAFRADLHIHTVISPCGDLEMSPRNIVDRAKAMGLDIIGVADHNCTKHAQLIQELAAREGIFTLMGAEITTREEAHCLCFVPDLSAIDKLQKFIEAKLPPIPLDTKYFGYQVVVNEQEEILEELPYLLITGLDASIEEVEAAVHGLNGIFIPAHINKDKFSVISQLGFIPFGLKYDALEITAKTTKAKFCASIPTLEPKTFVQCSDAHTIDAVGASFSNFYIEQPTFSEVRMALLQQEGRYVEIP